MNRHPFTAACLRLAVALLCAFLVPAAQAARVKDLANVQGVRNNQLVGYGLVVGLDGTGDQTTQTPFTTQSLMSMLSNLGINVPPGTRLQLKNVAAVMVTAMLPPFSQPGQQVDVTVSSMGNAKSLRGGTLLLTPLKGLDGQVYAMAQGSVSVGGAGASAAGIRPPIQQLSAGRIPAGATVEGAVPPPFSGADSSTARAMVETINRRIGPGTATALDGRVIELRAPSSPDARVAFMAQVEDLEVAGSRAPARVVINARTGSVVMNQSVRLAPVAVAHGNLSVTVSAAPVVSQPAPFSGGQTVVTERADIEIKQSGGAIVHLDGGAQLAEVVKALNLLCATPQDLISILQALKTAGALTAELEII